MHLWSRLRPAADIGTPPISVLRPEPAPLPRVELVYTPDELGGLESRLRAALPVTEVGALRTPATLANAVRRISIEVGADARVEVHRRPAVLTATECWEVLLWDVPGAARERLSSVLGRPI